MINDSPGRQLMAAIMALYLLSARVLLGRPSPARLRRGGKL